MVTRKEEERKGEMEEVQGKVVETDKEGREMEKDEAEKGHKVKKGMANYKVKEKVEDKEKEREEEQKKETKKKRV